MDEIRARLAEIKHQRSLMTQWDRAVLVRDELAAQRESWIRAMAPCEHGVADFEDCSQCRTPTTPGKHQIEAAAIARLSAFCDNIIPDYTTVNPTPHTLTYGDLRAILARIKNV